MTDWGIPNWLDKSAYGNAKRSENRWRWEFTRRREDCRKDFEAHKDETVRFIGRLPDAKSGRLLRPDEAGFVVQFPGCYDKYGLHALPNPAIGDQPFHVIMFPKRGPSLLLWPEDGIKEGFLETTQAVITIDLTAPLGDQLKAARRLLEGQQKATIGRLVRPGRKHQTKWLRYLRVLDARESGATYSEIARSGVLNGLGEDQQCARDVLQAAEALCFKWPA
jgi:hypothetical protein